MPVVRLDETMVNRIAAGEVVERPASVVRELVDNAIDAGATRIDVLASQGGRDLMRVIDDGRGMSRDDLALAVERHCTSKLTDLDDIRTLGFRGEALPSIGSVARLAITTRRREDDHAWAIAIDAGDCEGPEPARASRGTMVEVANLFHATPARRKFLKTPRAEWNAILDHMKRVALGRPEIRFTLSDGSRETVWSAHGGEGALGHRIEAVMGRDFFANAIPVEGEREGARLTGMAALPTFNRGNGLAQFVFVNGRPVRDRQLTGAIRGAYSDHLAKDRHPVCVLFLDVPPGEVDVNVHPAKSEVRFRDAGNVKALIVGTLRRMIADAGHRTAFRPDGIAARAAGTARGRAGDRERERIVPFDAETSVHRPLDPVPSPVAGFGEPAQPAIVRDDVISDEPEPVADRPMGFARAQLHENYIVSQTPTGMILVDAHAAHERIVYEGLKASFEKRGTVPSQGLLVPHVFECDEADANRLEDHSHELAALGLELERFGTDSMLVRSVPALLGKPDMNRLMRDVADELAEIGSANALRSRIDHVMATIACHGSVRSGRRMNTVEMDALLRQMEATPHSGQCNHGRPTWVPLSLAEIESMFERR